MRTKSASKENTAKCFASNIPNAKNATNVFILALAIMTELRRTTKFMIISIIFHHKRTPTIGE